jgi:hypothetical protein
MLRSAEILVALLFHPPLPLSPTRDIKDPGHFSGRESPGEGRTRSSAVPRPVELQAPPGPAAPETSGVREKDARGAEAQSRLEKRSTAI